MQLDMATFEELKQISGADFINELVDTFLEDSPKLIREMKTALLSNDADSFRRAAHSLKSNSATFGATRLTVLSKEMEMLAKEKKLEEAGKLLSDAESTLQAVDAELLDLRQ